MYRILEQTDNFLLINKSHGYSVHKDQQECGLTMQLCEEMGEQLYLVHRLDKVTSGLMVFARNPTTAATLADQFRTRQIEKYYLAISDRKPRRKQGLIVGDMSRSRRSSWKLLRSRDNPAITQFMSCAMGEGKRLFLLKPSTGKTHQLRVALKSEGAPILGDNLYAGSEADRTYLHAYSLSFTLDGEIYRFRCLPDQGEHYNEQCIALIQENYQAPDALNWPRLTL